MVIIKDHIKYCYNNSIKNIILTFDMLPTMELDDIIAMLYLTTYYDYIIDFSDIYEKDLECARTSEYWIKNDHKNMNEVILFYTLCMSDQLANTLYELDEVIDPHDWYVLFSDGDKDLKLTNDFLGEMRMFVHLDEVDPLICSNLFRYIGARDISYFARYLE